MMRSLPGVLLLGAVLISSLFCQKSGTNSLHGSASYYNRNEALAAESYFAPDGSPKNKMRNRQFGFSAGGPIIKDKTFFFLTYEGQK